MIRDGFLGPRFTRIGPINVDDLLRLACAVNYRRRPHFIKFVYCHPRALR